MYFCMKNSPLTEDEFHSSLLNGADHYQVNLSNCLENLIFLFLMALSLNYNYKSNRNNKYQETTLLSLIPFQM